jgi:hypothetical protein
MTEYLGALHASTQVLGVPADRKVTRNPFVLLRNAAMLNTMFFGLLRRSDTAQLTRGDVREVKQDYFVLRIRNSKTDQVGNGATVLVLLRTADHDWRKVWADYWAALPSNQGEDAPLFPSTHKGKPQDTPLGKDGVGAAFKKTLKDMNALSWFDGEAKAYGSQSLRRGGATFFARIGAEPWFLKTQGRWRSDTYAIYCDRTWGDQLATLAKLSTVQYMEVS